MKIVVINTAASSGGALSILKDFYDYIKLNDTQNEWIFILSDKYIDEVSNIKILIKKEPKLSWYERLKWEFIDGFRFINGLNPDIVISMQNTMNIKIKSKKIIYLHQPLPFQNKKNFSLWKKEERILAIYQHIIGIIIKKSLNNVDKVIVQTKWMKKSVLSKTKRLENEVIVAPPNIKSIDLKVKDNSRKFFYPASAISYKNHKCIIEAVKMLVEHGIDNFTVELTLDKDHSENLEITKDIDKIVKFIGNIERKEVFEKYQSSVLLFPSYIETFGLPMLEAREVGSIILASNCEFSKEILDDYANKYYFDPFKPEELANLMKLILEDKIARVSINNEKRNNETNSWSNVLDEIYSLGRGE